MQRSSSSSAMNEPVATSKWHTWAQEEAQHQKSDSHSPKITHSRSHSTKVSAEPTTSTLQELGNEPTLCFCKKPAHREYTLEYGPILECASYGYTGPPLASYQGKYTCGFHVHETSWNKHKQHLNQGLTIQTDYPELRTCPLYNFTFCTVFLTTNNHEKVPPSILPDCFCGHRVKLCDARHRIYFTCQGFNAATFKKCSWKLEARDVAFTKPKHRLHNYVSLQTYEAHLNNKSDIPVTKTQHFNNLLDSLNATARSSPTGLIGSSALTSPNSIQDEWIEETIISPQQQQQQQQQQRLMHALIVPTAVLAKKQPSVSNSSSTSTVSTVSPTAVTHGASLTAGSSPTMLKALHELEEYKTTYANLKATLHRVKQEAQARIGQVEGRLATSVEHAEQLQALYETKMVQYQQVLAQEYRMRISSQERLSTIELEVVQLLNEKERVSNELEVYKESMRVKYGKEDEFNKCKVCFHRSIEYVLIPCFHFAYCHLCAFKLKECALCRRPITDIQKIFTC